MMRLHSAAAEAPAARVRAQDPRLRRNPLRGPAARRYVAGPMPTPMVECVPNFSEGRDRAKIKQITDAIEAVGGVTLLNVEPGVDTHRTVVTFVGSPAAVERAAFAGHRAGPRRSSTCARHAGAHPRMGATDVCPFVPVEGVTMEDCVAIARRLGERVGSELGIPVYLYEAAATSPSRRSLSDIRRGEYEGLAKKLADPAWKPDFGPARAQRRRRRDGHRRAAVPHRLQRQPQLHRQGPRLRHRLRPAREGARRAQRQHGAVLRARQEARLPRGRVPLRQLRLRGRDATRPWRATAPRRTATTWASCSAANELHPPDVVGKHGLPARASSRRARPSAGTWRTTGARRSRST